MAARPANNEVQQRILFWSSEFQSYAQDAAHTAEDKSSELNRTTVPFQVHTALFSLLSIAIA